MKTPYGNKVKVYDLEKNLICDIIRNKKKLRLQYLHGCYEKDMLKRKDRNSIKSYIICKTI